MCSDKSYWWFQLTWHVCKSVPWRCRLSQPENEECTISGSGRSGPCSLLSRWGEHGGWFSCRSSFSGQQLAAAAEPILLHSVHLICRCWEVLTWQISVSAVAQCWSVSRVHPACTLSNCAQCLYPQAEDWLHPNLLSNYIQNSNSLLPDHMKILLSQSLILLDKIWVDIP